MSSEWIEDDKLYEWCDRCNRTGLAKDTYSDEMGEWTEYFLCPRCGGRCYVEHGCNESEH